MRKTVDEVKAGTTVSQFFDWMEILKEEWNEHTSEIYHLAQIAYEIHLLRLAWTGGTPKPFKEFLITFVFNETKFEIDPEEAARQARELRIAQSKAAWLGAAGIDPEDPNKEKKDAVQRTALMKNRGGVPVSPKQKEKGK